MPDDTTLPSAANPNLKVLAFPRCLWYAKPMSRTTESLFNRTRLNETAWSWPIPPTSCETATDGAGGLGLRPTRDPAFKLQVNDQGRPSSARIWCLMLLALNVSLWTMRHAPVTTQEVEATAPPGDAAPLEPRLEGEG